jgi:hypothetical protein
VPKTSKNTGKIRSKTWLASQLNVSPARVTELIRQGRIPDRREYAATSYFNNISITPEPSSAAVLGLTAFARTTATPAAVAFRRASIATARREYTHETL